MDNSSFYGSKHTPFTGKIKVGFGDTKISFDISREDIGTFIVEQLSNKTYEYSMPIIGS